ncbi:hypothetical protein NST62_02450 [Ureibacillus sp. FSL K6-8385]|uniref:Uncharacterized protein n=1 Tax=Ureibacillus terrenus TaxID=118246 RepID=A0A540V5J2_9BACL|nr:hypothetical protein [Ureibacillus terrenus]MED3661780.1 hypothetical protein [Ureibacillus terrenus]MED3763083.1 hypothetical protein [Ureibacillus terrenus]TQE91403.1 hypothetical protein FKZ59_05345 [Ureibacillus terrenus]
MAHIPIEAVPHLESAIYLPMLITILERDCRFIEQGPFKLKRPYLHLIEEAKRLAMSDLQEAKSYLKRRFLKVERGGSDDLFTEYRFYYKHVMEVRRYSNIRLRNRVEELLNLYLTKASNPSLEVVEKT